MLFTAPFERGAMAHIKDLIIARIDNGIDAIAHQTMIPESGPKRHSRLIRDPPDRQLYGLLKTHQKRGWPAPSAHRGILRLPDTPARAFFNPGKRYGQQKSPRKLRRTGSENEYVAKCQSASQRYRAENFHLFGAGQHFLQCNLVHKDVC